MEKRINEFFNDLSYTIKFKHRFNIPNELIDLIILHDVNFDTSPKFGPLAKHIIHIYEIIKILNESLYNVLNNESLKMNYKIFFTRITLDFNFNNFVIEYKLGRK